jgi:hypothetical protein
MSALQKQVASLQKRVASIENQLKQDANLSEIREMLADIVRTVQTDGGPQRSRPPPQAADGRAQGEDYPTRRPPSHVIQTRFRVL